MTFDYTHLGGNSLFSHWLHSILVSIALTTQANGTHNLHHFSPTPSTSMIVCHSIWATSQITSTLVSIAAYFLNHDKQLSHFLISPINITITFAISPLSVAGTYLIFLSENTHLSEWSFLKVYKRCPKLTHQFHYIYPDTIKRKKSYVCWEYRRQLNGSAAFGHASINGHVLDNRIETCTALWFTETEE